MTFKIKSLICLIITLLIIAFSQVILRSPADHTQPIKKNALHSFVQNAHFSTYSKKGKLKLSVVSSQVNHFSPLTQFTRPTVFLHTTSGKQWRIKSDSAQTNNNGKTIVLTGHIVIDEMSQKDALLTRITTTQLTLHPSLSQAHTNAYVTISKKNMVLTGTGLDANLKTGKYKIKKNARGRYTPNG